MEKQFPQKKLIDLTTKELINELKTLHFIVKHII